MKKQVIRKIKRALSAATMLGLGIAATSSTAMAVELDNNNRLGDAGIFQYYTATGDWQTFIRIINTSENAVAVKVRFREAANSREVLDYTIFLSPFDMWTGWTDKNAGGPGVPGVKTNDTSCLYPIPDNNPPGEGWVTTNFPEKVAAFQSRAFTDKYADGGTLNPPSANDRMSEGHIEVIGIGQFNPLGAFGLAVTHNQGVPNDCEGAASLYEDNSDIPGLSRSSDLENVLAMNGYMVNVPMGMGGGFNPDILKDFWTCDYRLLRGCRDGNGGYVDPPESLQEEALETQTAPDMDSAFNPTLVWNGLNVSRMKQEGIEGAEEVYGGVDQVSFALMRASVINEWAASNNPAAVVKDYYTQWVLSFPTKNYYVDLQTDPLPTEDDVSPALVDPDPDDDTDEGYRPFAHEFNYNGTGESCEEYYMWIYNREERYSTYASPGPYFPVSLCYETNVVVFNEAYETTGLMSNFAYTIPSGLLPTDVVPGGASTRSERGWAEMDFYDYSRYLEQQTEAEYDGDPPTYTTRYGLPVTGFMLSVYNTNDIGTNHAAINAHAYAIDEETDEGQISDPNE